MNDKLKDKLVLEALLERFEKHRLPRLMDIKKRLGQGNKLSDFEIEFMEEVFRDARNNEHYLEVADDELKALFMKVMAFYKEITEKAMENEQKS